jgi:4-hydroxy-4-methyl-2-oxoglutarate aldolase
MFVANDSGPPLDPTLVERYSSIRTMTIGHRLDHGFVGPDVTALVRRQSAAGRAVTVRPAGVDWSAAQFAVSRLEPGDVVVMDMSGDHTHSCWGLGMTLASMARGAVAAVVDGAVHDVRDIEDEGFPVWSRTISAKTARGLVTGGEINVPVRCGNATVHPGDLVVADHDGVVALGPVMAARWLPVFEAWQHQLAGALDRLRHGAPLSPFPDADALRAAATSLTSSDWDRLEQDP